MNILLSPMRSDDVLAMARAGDVLTINGEAFDLSGIPEGASLPASAVKTPWLTGEIHRQDGQLVLTVIMPHGANPPRDVAFPEPLLDVPDGPIQLPTGPVLEADDER